LQIQARRPLAPTRSRPAQVSLGLHCDSGPQNTHTTTSRTESLPSHHCFERVIYHTLSLDSESSSSRLDVHTASPSLHYSRLSKPPCPGSCLLQHTSHEPASTTAPPVSPSPYVSHSLASFKPSRSFDSLDSSSSRFSLSIFKSAGSLVVAVSSFLDWFFCPDLRRLNLLS
jgi:hypothetical protein